MNLLFSNIDVYEICEARKNKIVDSARNMSQNQLDNSADEDLTADLIDKFRLNIPRLVYGDISVSRSEARIDVSRDPRRIIFDRSEPFFVSGIKIVVHIPFEGDSKFFSVRPNRFTLNPPRADILENQLQIVFSIAEGDSSEVKVSYEATLRQIEDYLTSLREAAAVLDKDLEQLAVTNVQERRKHLQSSETLIASLGLPQYIPKSIESVNISRQEQAKKQVSWSNMAKVPAGKKSKDSPEWDLFISHASENKEEIARPLTLKLQQAGFKVWLDEINLLLGDSLRKKIDEGLSRSRFGAIVLSEEFFSKEWTNAELDGLVSREADGHKVILPIWHRITKAQVAAFSPMLAGRLAVSTSEGLEKVVEKIAAVLNTPKA